MDAWLTQADVSIQNVKSVCSLKYLEAGQTILSESESSQRVYFILKGRVAIILYSKNGHEVRLSQLASGNWIGETDALIGGGHRAYALTSEPVTLAVMAAPAFNTLMHQENGFTIAIARQLAERVAATSQRMFEYAAYSASGRLYSEIIRRSTTGKDSVERVVSPPPSITGLATYLSISRETASRIINKLEKMHILERKPDQWRILAPDRLSDMIQGRTPS